MHVSEAIRFGVRLIQQDMLREHMEHFKHRLNLLSLVPITLELVSRRC